MRPSASCTASLSPPASIHRLHAVVGTLPSCLTHNGYAADVPVRLRVLHGSAPASDVVAGVGCGGCRVPPVAVDVSGAGGHAGRGGVGVVGGGLVSEPKAIVMVHPDDVNLADAKAACAEHNATVVGNEWCPRGTAFLINPAVLLAPWRSDLEDPDQ